MKKWMRFHIIWIMIYVIVVGTATGQEVIKLGTLAPEGSAWGKIFKQMNAALKRESHDQLQFQFRFGLSENVLIPLIENRQLDAVAMTAIGLGGILPEIFVFQLPMLFSTYEELDCVRDALTAHFSAGFSSEGYVLLGWCEVGFVRLFSKEPIRTWSEIQRTRFWVWEIDPLGKAFASKLERQAVTLPIQQVLEGLKKDTIQTVYASPLACIVLGWHTQTKYMSDFSYAAGVGATIIRKRRYDQLSEKHQRLLLKITKEYHKKLIDQIRKDNERSIDVLKQQGIQIVSIPLRERQKWLEVAMEVQDQFVGDLYSDALYLKVRSVLEECRQQMQSSRENGIP